MSQWVTSLYTMSSDWVIVNSLMLQMLGKQSWPNGVKGLRKQRKSQLGAFCVSVEIRIGHLSEMYQGVTA
jgi:hypothetical protein